MYQQGVHPAPSGQRPVSGDDQPALGLGPRHQRLVGAVTPVFGVIAQQAQPFCQPAAHGINQHARRFTFGGQWVLW